MSFATLQRKARGAPGVAGAAPARAGPGAGTVRAPAWTSARVASPFRLAGVQRQVKVGGANDAAEHEANRTADHVTSGSSASMPTISRLESLQREVTEKRDRETAPQTGPVQRAEGDSAGAENTAPAVQRAESKMDDGAAPVQRAETAESRDAASVQRCCGCPGQQMENRPSGTASVLCKFRDESDPGESVRRKEANDMDTAAAHAIATKDSGSPLRPDVRGTLETRLGADLSGVRVHEGAAAHESAAALNARAFTHKSDIWLGRGESQDNLHLMAHEATHVVQQGAAVRTSAAVRDNDAPRQEEDSGAPVVRRSIWSKITGVAGAVWDHTGGVLVDAAGKVIGYAKDLAWKVVKELAPQWLIDFIEEVGEVGGSIIDYLRKKATAGFDAVFGGLTRAGDFLSGIVKGFGKMLNSAGEILAALGHGDCQPLFDALGRLGDILSEMAGEAWDRIKDFFAPVGDFLSTLWDKLKDAASAVWDGIKSIFNKIWDATQPIRDALGAAWDWIKDKLGIGGGDSSGDSSGGLIGWISDKISAAWDWVTDKMQPVLGPLKSFVAKIKAILPIDAILDLRKKVHEWLQHVGYMIKNMRKPQGVTENQGSLRDKILPAVKGAILGLRDKIVGAGAWIADKIGGVGGTVANFFSNLRDNFILKYFAGALSWVEDKVNGLTSWVQSGVTGLFNTVGRGVAKLADFVEPVLNVLKKIVAVVANVVKELPGLILGPVWRAIPACIREPIKKFLINHILNHIPIISTFLKVPEIWSKIQKMVMNFLTQVFVNGDLSGAAMTVIRFVLEAVGVDVDLFLTVLANAISALDDIIMHPIKFLTNLFDAVKKGTGQFISRIGTHLINGLVAWLVGPLADLGVKPLKDLTLTSILDMVLQILGISADKLQKKLEKAVGPKAVRLLTEAWNWIKALITGGLAGLWEQIQNRLSDLWNIVIGGITEWITTELIEAGIERLVEMSNPVGAIIEAIRTIYTFVTFIVSKINQILQVANSVVNSISKIAAGAIGDAANAIEDAMARTVPQIIAFFADWIGIGDPGPTIHDIVKKIQGKVDAALDWLIDKAIGIGKSILKGLGLRDDEKEGEEEESPKWKAGVAGVTSDLEAMSATGLEEAAIEAKFPEWKATYGFSELEVTVVGDDFEIDGSMSPKKKTVARKGSGLHKGTPDDPIPIHWYKPEGDYTTPLSLVDPDTDKKFTASMFGSVTKDDPRRGHSGDTVTLGVSSANRISKGKVLTRTGGTAGERGGGQGALIRILDKFGYDMSAAGDEADHVKDLGFSGIDDLNNLWPLQSATNQIGRTYYSSYMVEYLENKKEEKGNLTSLDGKSFKVIGFQWPPPKLPGGRD